MISDGAAYARRVTKLFRILLRFSLLLAALIIALLILGLDGVDYRPYLREPYYAETTARLRAHKPPRERRNIRRLEQAADAERHVQARPDPADQPHRGY